MVLVNLKPSLMSRELLSYHDHFPLKCRSLAQRYIKPHCESLRKILFQNTNIQNSIFCNLCSVR